MAMARHVIAPTSPFCASTEQGVPVSSYAVPHIHTRQRNGITKGVLRVSCFQRNMKAEHVALLTVKLMKFSPGLSFNAFS